MRNPSRDTPYTRPTHYYCMDCDEFVRSPCGIKGCPIPPASAVSETEPTAADYERALRDAEAVPMPDERIAHVVKNVIAEIRFRVLKNPAPQVSGMATPGSSLSNAGTDSLASNELESATSAKIDAASSPAAAGPAPVSAIQGTPITDALDKHIQSDEFWQKFPEPQSPYMMMLEHAKRMEAQRSATQQTNFWPIGYINDDGGITFEPGREPGNIERGKLVYIARGSDRTGADQ